MGLKAICSIRNLVKKGKGVIISHPPNHGQFSQNTIPGEFLIAVSLQGKLAGPRGCRIGIACPKETPDGRLLVDKITRNTHRCRD